MRLSTFNVIKSQDDTTWVYNTFTQGFIKLSTCEWKELEASVENLMLDSSHPLVRTGIVVNSVSEQLTTYKYSYYANMFKDITPLIYIAPSMDCNLNCFYCFEKGNKYAGVMNDEVIRGLVDFICKTGKNKLLCTVGSTMRFIIKKESVSLFSIILLIGLRLPLKWI